MRYPNRIFVRFAFAIAIAAFTLVTAISLAAQAAAGVSPTTARISSAYGKLPISFEINQGQTDHSVQFLARGSGYSLFLTPCEAVLALHSARRKSARTSTNPGPDVRSTVDAQTSYSTSTVRVRLIGANISAGVAGLEPLPGKSNYLIGNDPAKWHTDIPTYAKVRYSGIYPGIDLIYYGNQEGRLEHDFIVAPGADPNTIAMDFTGTADSLFENADGDLVLRTKSGDLHIERPAVYQMINDRKKTVEAAYTLKSENKVAFTLGDYDKRVPLVIDPVIQYSGNFGGSNEDAGVAIAVDSARNAYVTGVSVSTNFPLVNPYQKSAVGETNAFVAKVNASGTALVYSTYLGNSTGDTSQFSSGVGIAVDYAGRAYVAGIVMGSSFPVKNAFQPVTGGSADAFLSVLNPAGNGLIYSTYLGGSGGDLATGIALDSSANAYVTGSAGSPPQGSNFDFPTLHSVQPEGGIFVAKFNNAGALQYSSVFGDAPGSAEAPHAIAVDMSGSVYITGHTSSQTFPIRTPAFQSKCTACPGQTGFVTKLSPSGNSLVYSTFLGGAQAGAGNAIAVDTAGNAYIGGFTGSGFPVTANALQKTYGGGGSDGYVAKLNPSGSGLVYSTYLGGNTPDDVLSLALDQYRQVYVSGFTSSANFPFKASIQALKYPPQIFVTTLSATGGSISYYSTLFAPGTAIGAAAMAIDKSLNVYLTGETKGRIPVTPGAINTAGVSSGNVFVSKLVIMDDLSIAVSASPSPVAHGGNLTYTIATTSKGPDFAVNLRVTDVLPAGTTFVSDNAGGGSCTAPAVGGTGTLHCVLAQLNKGDTYTVKLTVRVTAAAGSTIKDTASTVSNTQDFVKSNNTGTVTTKVD